MRRWWHILCAVAAREVRRIVHRPLYAALLTVLPVGAFLFFVALFRTGGVDDLPIGLIDEDHTTLSRRLAAMIEATPAAQITAHPSSAEEAERLIRTGRIWGFVWIPAGFERGVLQGRSMSIGGWISGANLTTNALLAKDVEAAVQTLSVGLQIERFTTRGLAATAAAEEAMPIRYERHVLFNPYVNYAYYLAPSFLAMMLLIFVLMATIYAVGSELREGSAAAWLDAADGSIGLALLGKCLPVTLAMQLLSVGMVALLAGWIGVPLNGSIVLLLAANLLLIAAYQSISLLLLAGVDDLRLALSLGGGYGVLAFTFSGLTFPLPAMWPPMRWLSVLFPFTPYTELLLDQLLRGAPIRSSLPALGWLALFAVLPLVVVPRLKRLAADAAYWYKV